MIIKMPQQHKCVNDRRNYHMTISKVFWILVLTLVACSSRQQRKLQTDTPQYTKSKGTSHNVDHFPFIQQKLNKKNVTANGNYYMLTQSTDSTVKITWGNDSITRVYDEPLDFMFAERLKVEWNNKDYLILRYGVGSGAWETVAFPMNNIEQVQVFDNGLCFDTKYNLLGMEQFEDTVLTVQNLKTGQIQFIIEKQKPCDAASNSACIDTISIRNKVLYYKWITPHKFSDKKNSIEKHVRLTI
jgi:hypothetical protein